MPTFSSLQVPPPANWQDFQTLCCDLWRKIWEDQNTQENGRQGQPQHGVDIYGRPRHGESWAGVQCKGKDNYAEKALTAKEVKDEIEKAKSFKPKLSEFIIATTGQRDAKLQELARKITDKHLKKGLFSVYIWFWNDIKNSLEDFPEVLEKHCGFSSNTRILKKGINELKETTQEILKNNVEVKSSLSSFSGKIDNITSFYNPDISSAILASEYQADLDYARDLLKKYKPKEALEFLDVLKNRIWSDAQPIVKFRLLTNIGSAKLSLNQEKEAAELFLEALQYNPEDEKALCNASLGYILLGQLNEANVYANKALGKNPANNYAHSLIIQASSDNEDLESIIAKIPEPYRISSNVAYAISHMARKRGNLIETKKWLEIAIENDKENLAELKGALGETLLELVVGEPSAVYAKQINDTQKDILNKSMQLLTDAWQCILNTDLRYFRLGWIANRSIAKRFLGDLEGAIKDIEIALETDPSNPIFIKHRAILAFESNDNPKAKSLLKKILSTKETPESPLLLAEILRDENSPNEAIPIINGFLKNNPPEPLQEEANRLLIQLYIDAKYFENAKKISDSMRVSDPANILNLVNSAWISRFSGKREDAISFLKEAKKYITTASPFRQLLEVANEFYVLEEFEDAANIYEKIADKNIYSPLTHHLLNSYYRSGEIGQALQICQSLRNKYGPLEYVSEMESAIYEEIEDLPKSKKVCQEYLNIFPNNFKMKLRQAVVNLRSGDFEELDKFLSFSIDISALSLESCLQVAYLYTARNLDQKSLEIMYETRRKFFNDADAHLKYISLFFGMGKRGDEWLTFTNVSIDTAVCMKDDSGQQEWYIIIENRKDADIHRKEINLEHPLAQKLLGKSVGDDILLKEYHLSKKIERIIEIKSKYVYALHESLSLFERLFSDTPGLWGIKVGPPEKEGELPKGFQIIFDEISRQHDIHLKVEQLYKEGSLTIGAFADLIGRDVLSVWNGMINKPDLGLKCCLGNIEERNYAISLLNNKPKLIVDIISLMTLHAMNAGDIIIKAFEKLGIAQTTIDLIQNTMNERKGIQSKGHMTIGKEDDKFTRQEISAEDVKRNIEYLESIMNWIQNNCEVISCKKALNIKRADKQHLEKMIGRSFIDTVLIASESGNLLYSDDERLRSFAKGEFDVDGVWTQIILMHCCNIKVLEKSKYNEAVVKLACFHYYHTSIDANILIESARQSKWSPLYPYTTVVNILIEKSSDEGSALVVATNFLYELLKQQILSHQCDNLILSLLDTITIGRNRRVILDKLISYVEKRFFLLPLQEKQILSLIEVWKHIHIL